MMCAELGAIDVAQLHAEARVLLESEDGKEGAAAFAERRPPRWTGR